MSSQTTKIRADDVEFLEDFLSELADQLQLEPARPVDPAGSMRFVTAGTRQERHSSPTTDDRNLTIGS